MMSLTNKFEKNVNKYIFSIFTYYILLPIKNYFIPKNILIFIKNGKEILKLNNNDINYINNINEIINYNNVIDYDYILFNINNVMYKKTNVTVSEYNQYNKLTDTNQFNNFYTFNKSDLFLMVKSINQFIKIYKDYNLNNCTQFLYYHFINDYKTNVSFLDCKLIYNDKMYPININNYILNNNNILSYEFIKYFIHNNTNLINEYFDKKHFFDNYKIYIMDDNISEFHIKNDNYISINKNDYIIIHKSINYENTIPNHYNYFNSTPIIDMSNNIIDCINCDNNDDSDNCKIESRDSDSYDGDQDDDEDHDKDDEVIEYDEDDENYIDDDRDDDGGDNDDNYSDDNENYSDDDSDDDSDDENDDENDDESDDDGDDDNKANENVNVILDMWNFFIYHYI
jgi:hypothetical protein